MAHEHKTTWETASYFTWADAEADRAWDELVNESNAVISDIVIRNDGLSEDDFADMLEVGAPVGFADFKKFIAGDYEFQRAMFRTRVRASSTDRPRISNLKLTVDMPDVLDRGHASIPADPSTVVLFNKTFSVAPEVVATQQGGSSVGRVQVIEVTSTQFTVVILDASDDPMAATISWTAVGY
jgi:hypothetical protein